MTCIWTTYAKAGTGRMILTMWIEVVVLIVASLTTLATARNLGERISRRRRLRERGVNGAKAAHADWLVAREVRRVVKHCVAVLGIALILAPLPDWLAINARTILFGVLCVMFMETSFGDRRNDGHLEELLERQ